MTRLPTLARWALRLVPARHRELVAGDLVEEARVRGLASVAAWRWLVWESARAGLRARLESLRRRRGRKGPGRGGHGMGMAEWKHAGRRLRRAPGLTATALVTLGLGLGGATAFFSVVKGVLLDPLPYPQADRLVAVWLRAKGVAPGRDALPVSDGIARHFRQGARAFEGMALWGYDARTWTGVQRPERLRGALVGADFFRVLGVRAELGRVPDASAGVRGAEPVVVLSHDFWMNRLGGDPDVVGGTLELGGVRRTVVGIAPPGFAYPDTHLQYWLTYAPRELSPTSFDFQVVARLAPGATLESADADLTRMVATLGERFPVFSAETLAEVGLAAFVEPLKSTIVGDVGHVLWLLLAGAGVVLAIACVNVANLLLVRAEGRTRELAVRRALGAGRGSLVRFFMAEAGLLALGGGVLGVLAALGAVPALLHLAPPDLPRVQEVGIDLPVLLFALALVALATLVVGALPSLRLRGVADVAHPGAGGRTGTEGTRHRRVRNVLVVSEVALATALLVGSGLLVRSVQALTRVDPGFAPEGLSTARVLLPQARYPDAAAIVDFWRSLGDALRARAGVEEATVAQTLPLAGGFSATGFQAEGGVGTTGDSEPSLQFKRVGSRYLETLGIPVLAGRPLGADDQRQDANTVVVSAAAAAALWPGASLPTIPGRRLRPSADGPWYTVVGVSADAHEQRLDAPPGGVVMFGFWGRMDEGLVALARSMAVAVRARPGAETTTVAVMRETLAELDGTLALADATTMTAVLRSRRARPTFVMTLSLVSAAVALVLGLVGTYGVISYMVTRRTREIGVRVAMGARGSDIGTLVLRLGLVLVGAGLVLGMGLAAVLSRALRSVLFGVPALDPWTYLGVGLLLAATGLLASVLPARRAARIPAVEALRTE